MIYTAKEGEGKHDESGGRLVLGLPGILKSQSPIIFPTENHLSYRKSALPVENFDLLH